LIQSGKQPSELYMNRNERVARWRSNAYIFT